jgi:fido (protein-threonine AMPylation protein)
MFLVEGGEDRGVDRRPRLTDQDVYDWAGTYRTVRISKGENSFCYPEHIPSQMNALFQKIRNGDTFTVCNRTHSSMK